MHSIIGVSWGTGNAGTRKASNGVSACGSSATTTIVCRTLVDICIIANQLRIFCRFETCSVAQSLQNGLDKSAIIIDYSYKQR